MEDEIELPPSIRERHKERKPPRFSRFRPWIPPAIAAVLAAAAALLTLSIRPITSFGQADVLLGSAASPVAQNCVPYRVNGTPTWTDLFDVLQLPDGARNKAMSKRGVTDRNARIANGEEIEVCL